MLDALVAPQAIAAAEADRDDQHRDQAPRARGCRRVAGGADAGRTPGAGPRSRLRRRRARSGGCRPRRSQPSSRAGLARRSARGGGRSGRTAPAGGGAAVGACGRGRSSSCHQVIGAGLPRAGPVRVMPPASAGAPPPGRSSSVWLRVCCESRRGAGTGSRTAPDGRTRRREPPAPRDRSPPGEYGPRRRPDRPPPPGRPVAAAPLAGETPRRGRACLRPSPRRRRRPEPATGRAAGPRPHHVPVGSGDGPGAGRPRGRRDPRSSRPGGTRPGPGPRCTPATRPRSSTWRCTATVGGSCST